MIRPTRFAVRTWRRAVRFLGRNEDGSTAVEYALLLALIVVASIVSIQALTPRLLANFQTSSAAVGTYGVP